MYSFSKSIYLNSQELLPMPKDDHSSESNDFNTSGRRKDPAERKKHQAELRRKISERLSQWKRHHRVKSVSSKNEGDLNAAPDMESSNSTNAIITPLFYHGDKQDTGKSIKPSILKLVYYDPLDLLLCGFEDSKIGVWGYNEDAFKNVPGNQGNGHSNSNSNGTKDGVSNRVAGLTCRHMFQEHRDAVLAICPLAYNSKIFGNNNRTCHYMLTSGADQKLFLYDLEKGTIMDSLKDPVTGKDVLAADAAVNDMDYSPETERFAYVSSDGQGYLRKFSEEGRGMTLIAVLQGHESDVTQVSKACHLPLRYKLGGRVYR